MFKEDYKVEVDKLCENTCNISAEDILVKAMNTSTSEANENDNVVEFHARPRKKRFVKKTIVLIAACVAVLGMAITATAATIAPEFFVNLFRVFFKDEITAEIVEQGYISQLDITKSTDDGKYTISLSSFTGDSLNPVLTMDIIVHDEKTADVNEELKLEAYVLGTETYENDIDNYATWDMYAYKDPAYNNVYHVSFQGASAWLCTGNEVVVDIIKISGNEVEDDYSELVYVFTPTVDILYDAMQFAWPGFNVEYNGREYEVMTIEFSEYESRLGHAFKDFSDERIHMSDEFWDLGENVKLEYEEMRSETTIIVDGVEYKPQDEYTSLYYDSERDLCFGYYYFEGINYYEVNDIVLKVGEKEYIIKDSNNPNNNLENRIEW